MNRTTGILLTSLLAALSAPTWANSQSALVAISQNMNKAGLGWNIPQQDMQISDTLVRGVYRLSVKHSGDFLNYTNESGTLVGDSQGWRVVGEKLRSLSPQELAELRGELSRSIQYDHLAKVSYGTGGGRKLLLFSAVDCAYCAAFEQSAKQLAKQLDTTYYVVPSSLKPLQDGGATLTGWQAALRIECANDPGQAWQTYWSTRAVPAAGDCKYNEQTWAIQAYTLGDLMNSVGIAMRGTPTFVQEDGVAFTPRSNFDAVYAAAKFGPAGLPAIAANQPKKWLLAAAKNGDNNSAETGANGKQSKTAKR